MRIGFDVSQTGKDKAGCGYFADSLIRALYQVGPEHEYLLYASFGPYYWDAKAPNPALLRLGEKVRLYLRHSDFESAEFFWRNPPAEAWDEPLGEPDLIHANNFFVPYPLHRTRLIYTLYDLSFLHHPEWHTNANWVTTFLGGVYYASLFADGIVAISEYSRQDFLHMFPYFPPERIWAVPLASRFPLQSEKPRPPRSIDLRPGRFWLAVGTLEPRKNYPTLLQAYASFLREVPEADPLVIAGGQGWRMEYLRELIASLGLQQRVHLLGYVSDPELQWLYSHCKAFVYPSLFEGFGLPVLEAMSLGAAVLTSWTTSLPEVAGEAALLVDPHRVEELRDAMLQLHRNQSLRAELRERALAQAARFSWEHTARQVFAVYERVLSWPKRRVFVG